MRAPIAALLLCTIASGAQAQINHTVTASGTTAYRIDGILNPMLNLVRGETHVFNVNAIGHPFYIKTARVTGSGSQYTNGVTGQGVTSGSLTFVVPMDAPDQLYYQCGVHFAMGDTILISSPVDVPEGGLPNVVWLGPATPNPTHEGTSFRIGLPERALIDFAIYDLRGREVRRVARGEMPAGENLVHWDGRDRSGGLAPSGLYFYRLRIKNRVWSGRIVMAR